MFYFYFFAAEILGMNRTSNTFIKEKHPLKQEDLELLPKILKTEIDLYNFIVQRFYQLKSKLEKIKQS